MSFIYPVNVDMRMIILLAAASVALVVNAVIAWFAYKAIADMSAAANDRMDEFRRAGAKQWLMSLQTVSSEAAESTSRLKTEVLSLEPPLVAAQERLARSLARIDDSCDRTCSAVTSVLHSASSMASRGSWILSRIFSGARAASAFVRFVRAR